LLGFLSDCWSIPRSEFLTLIGLLDSSRARNPTSFAILPSLCRIIEVFYSMLHKLSHFFSQAIPIFRFLDSLFSGTPTFLLKIDLVCAASTIRYQRESSFSFLIENLTHPTIGMISFVIKFSLFQEHPK